MKKGTNKMAGVAKGAPSGFVISLIFHAVAFLLAGMFVVFTVVKKEEKKFVPPKPVERPKMKLKKPKVKIKKTSKPKPTNRIVTKVKRASMPDIQLPEMSGMGTGLGEGIGGFEMMPDLADLSQFGSKESVGSDLVGTYYDFNRLRSGADCVTDPVALAGLLAKFLTRDWSPTVFNRYYRAPQKLYASSIAMPPLQSTQAPEAFGEEGKGEGWCWLVHYKGELVHSEDIRFRFWGFGDDALAVRVDGELVLLSCFPQWVTDFQDHTEHLWQSSSPDNEKYPMANHHSKVGDWIELKAHEPKELEILIGESHGGIFAAMLCVEVEGVEYDRNPHLNGPTLPFFKTAEFSKDMIELIYSQLHPGEATCEMGPVFDDFSSVTATSRTPLVYADLTDPPLPAAADEAEPELRTWTLSSMKSFEAKYKTSMGSSVVLESARGKQKQIKVSDLSPEDRKYVMLRNPPKFKIGLSKSSNQRTLPETTPWLETNRRLQIVDYQFGVRLKPATVNKSYDFPLEVEYYVFGEETTGDNYVLLDRASESFTPSLENKGQFEFLGEREVEMKVQAVNDEGAMRGVKYGGYLVTVTDERGLIIQHKATHEFLYEKLENLKNVPLGKHFNENCNRVMPDRPKDTDRFTITL